MFHLKIRTLISPTTGDRGLGGNFTGRGNYGLKRPVVWDSSRLSDSGLFFLSLAPRLDRAALLLLLLLVITVLLAPVTDSGSFPRRHLLCGVFCAAAGVLGCVGALTNSQILPPLSRGI